MYDRAQWAPLLMDLWRPYILGGTEAVGVRRGEYISNLYGEDMYRNIYKLECLWRKNPSGVALLCDLVAALSGYFNDPNLCQGETRCDLLWVLNSESLFCLNIMLQASLNEYVFSKLLLAL